MSEGAPVAGAFTALPDCNEAYTTTKAASKRFARRSCLQQFAMLVKVLRPFSNLLVWKNLALVVDIVFKLEIEARLVVPNAYRRLVKHPCRVLCMHTCEAAAHACNGDLPMQPHLQHA